MDALQTVVSEKIPVRLIPPTTLLYILKKVSLNLPDLYRLVAGVDPSSVAWYFEYVQTTMVASLHGFMLILSIPLADASRFELFQMHAFPAHVFNQTFVSYNPGSSYLAVSVLQRTHFTVTESELLQCKGIGFKVCPASRSVYSTQAETCSEPVLAATQC
jgi:hypothetical protein